MISGHNFTEIIHSGGITLYILIFCSVVLIAAIIDRLIFYALNKLNYNVFLKKLIESIKAKDYEKALNECGSERSILTNVLRSILIRHSYSKEELENAAETSLNEEIINFDRKLTTIGTMAVVAPFIGLMGTVFGIMQAFSDIAYKGSIGPAAVAKGVSEALIATAAGLIVAIPASIFFNYFKTRSAFIKRNMSVLCSKLIEVITRSEQGAAVAEDLER